MQVNCLDDHELDALFTGSLDEEAQRVVEVHLDECNACRALAAELARLRGAGEPASMPTLGPATKVGRYLIVRLLGRGGMGEVWSAVDPDLDRLVAVKVVEASAASAAGEARLLREAQTLARVSHPNVVQVFDVGRFGSRVFIAMERLDGGTLDQWVAAEAPSWQQVLEALCAAGDGLVAAHRVDVVHRDFKPRNVLVADGRVCVSDFGLAASRSGVSAENGADRSVTPVGTETYLAPEQREGAPPSALGDQYSFCVTAQQLLGDAPRAVATVIRRGLSPDPSDRHPDMETLVHQLRRQASPNVSRWNVAVAAVAAGLVGAGVAHGTGGDACAAEDPLAGVWDATARSAIEVALARDALEPAVATGVMQQLDGWATQFRDVHQATCPADLRATVAGRCLSHRREEFVTTLGWLQSERGSATSPVAVVRALSGATACRDGGLGVVSPRPESVEGVADLSPLLGRITALTRQERLDEADALLASVRARAEDLGHPSTIAHVELRAAVLHGVRGRFEEQRDADERAASWAIEGRDDALLAAAWTDLCIVEGLKLRDDDGADRTVRWLGSLIDAGRVGVARRRHYWRARAVIAEARGRNADALDAWNEAIRAANGQLDADDPWLAEAKMYAAMIRARLGDGVGTREDGLAALRVTEAVYGPESGYARRMMSHLTRLLLDLGLAQEAGVYAARARAIAVERLPSGHPDRAAAVSLDATVRMRTHPPDYEGALALFRQASEGFAMKLGDEHPAVLTTDLNELMALNALERTEEAYAAFEALMPRIIASGGEDGLLAGRAHSVAGATLFNLDRLQDALVAYDRALVLFERHLGVDDAAVARVRISRERCRTRLGHDARPELRRILDARGFEDLTAELQARVRYALVEARWAAGEHREAIALARRIANDARQQRLPPAVVSEFERWLADHDG